MLQRVTLKEQVYQHIRQAIIEQRLEPGERLHELELAKMLNVSLTPVREALNKLKGDGLVVGDSWRGTFVIDLSVEEIASIFDVRQVLEATTVWWAGENMGKEDLEELAWLQEQYKKAYHVKPHSITIIQERNAAFHGFLVEKANNTWLKKILEDLNTHILIVRTPLTRNSTGEKSLQEHQAILESLQRRNVDRAVKAMEQHIVRMKKEVIDLKLKQLEEKEGGDSFADILP